DGSVIHLNTNSEVRICYTARIRHVRIVRGEALFRVERDAARPFRVSTDTAVIRAVGSEFDVYQQSARTRVAVVHGQVNLLALLPKRPTPLRHWDITTLTTLPGYNDVLVAEEQASVGIEGDIHKGRQPNFQSPADWAQRRLIFDNAPIADVAS